MKIYEFVRDSYPILRKVNRRWRDILEGERVDIAQCMQTAAAIGMRINLGEIDPATLENYFRLKYYELLTRAKYTWRAIECVQFLYRLYVHHRCNDFATLDAISYQGCDSRAVHMAKTHCFRDLSYDDRVDAQIAEGVIIDDNTVVDDNKRRMCRRVENIIIDIISRCQRVHGDVLVQQILTLNSLYITERAHRLGVSFEGYAIYSVWSNKMIIKLHSLGYSWPNDLLTYILLCADIASSPHDDITKLFEYVIYNGYRITDTDFIGVMKCELTWAIRAMLDAGYVIRKDLLADPELPPGMVNFARQFIN